MALRYKSSLNHALRLIQQSESRLKSCLRIVAYFLSTDLWTANDCKILAVTLSFLSRPPCRIGCFIMIWTDFLQYFNATDLHRSDSDFWGETKLFYWSGSKWASPKPKVWRRKQQEETHDTSIWSSVHFCHISGAYSICFPEPCRSLPIQKFLAFWIGGLRHYTQIHNPNELLNLQTPRNSIIIWKIQ